MSKTILIISRAFYPENSPRSFRTTELAKELSRQGHKVTVLTPHQKEHANFEKEHNISFESLGNPKWKTPNPSGIGIVKLSKRVITRVSQLYFDYPNIEYYFLVKKKIKEIINNKKKYDLLISIAVPHSIHWGIASLWEKNKENIAKKWIADCGDPFMGQENDTFKHPFYFKYFEKNFCKKADFISVPVESAIEAYYPEFHSKIKVIPQGFKFEDIQIAKQENSPFPRFAYAGGLIPGRRDPKDFLEFLVNYKGDFSFDIYTKQKSLVQQYADRSNGRIKLKDYLPREKLLFELSKLDFVVNFENAGEKQIPSKLIDYAIIQKPILSVNSFVFNEINAKEFLEGNYKNKVNITNSNQYRIENIADKFLRLC